MAERVASDKATNGNGNGQLTEEFVEEWRNAAYNCFSSGHKFCREVCPVMQVTRDEAHTPTAFHANVVAMEKGHLTIEDVARGLRPLHACAAPASSAARTRSSPATSTASVTRTVDLVKAMRALAVEQRRPAAGVAALERAHRRAARNEPVLGGRASLTGPRARLGRRPRPPVGGETILFCDCEAAFYRTSLAARRRPAPAGGRRRVRADARAVVLRRPGGRDGLRRSGHGLRRAQRRATGAPSGASGSSSSTRTTTSRSPRTTRATSATTTTSRSCSSSSSSPS